MIMAIIMGALSQPLVAYAFASFDSIYSVNNIDIKISDFYTEIFIIALAMIFSSFSHIVKNFISNIQMNNLRKDIGGVLKKLGDSFLADEEIQRLCSIYGDNGLKAEREELQMLLRLIHNKAMEACVQRNLKAGLVPEEEAQPILKHLSAGRARVPAYPYKQAEEAIKSG